jgi:hypothetical protein
LFPGLRTKNPKSAIEMLMAHPALLDDLRKAHTGNYGVILSLLGCLDNGLQTKKLVDRVIDDCGTAPLIISARLMS